MSKDPRYIYTAIQNGFVKVGEYVPFKMNKYIKGRHAGTYKTEKFVGIEVNFIIGFPYILVKKEEGIEVCGAWMTKENKKIRKTVILSETVCKSNLVFKSKYNYGCSSKR